MIGKTEFCQREGKSNSSARQEETVKYRRKFNSFPSILISYIFDGVRYRNYVTPLVKRKPVPTKNICLANFLK